MCGGFTISLTIGFGERFGVDESHVTLAPRYNIAPSQTVPVILTSSAGRRQAMPITWGLVPSWTRDPAGARPLINARAETLADRPAFRGPLMRQRCLVPATGFYEWAKRGRDRVPFYIRRKDSLLFAFAGLYDIWKGGGLPLFSFTIVTTAPDPLVARYHDRMPAILREEDEGRWLATASIPRPELDALLSPYPEEFLEAYQVSRAVNDPGKEGPELIRRIGGETLPV